VDRSNPSEFFLIDSSRDGMKSRLAIRGVDLDYATFNNYERQVSALIKGHIDIAWNGPLAHVRAQKRAGNQQMISLGMRDVDRDFHTYLITRKQLSNSSKIKDWKDLNNKRLAVGTFDSPQAYILPIHFLKTFGVHFNTLDITRFDKDAGKHGDTAVGEEDVLNAVLDDKSVDAGVVSRLMFDRCVRKKDLDVVKTFPLFDHCQFDCLATLPIETRKVFQEAVMSMNSSTSDEDRRIMNLEGIRERWETPRESGYDSMRDAVVDEPLIDFPPPLHTSEKHPFRSLTIISQ
jgi:phosphonate transport system substrate-binding protein